MESGNTYEGLDPLAANLVRRHARDLVRSGAIPTADLEDAEQDLMVHALAHIGKHDADIGRAPVYYDRVIGTKAKHLAEHRYALRRKPKAPVLGLEHGLSVEPRDVDPGGFSEEEIRRIGPVPARAEAETLQLRMDVQAAIHRLPPAQRDIASRASLGLSVHCLDLGGSGIRDLFFDRDATKRLFVLAGGVTDASGVFRLMSFDPQTWLKASEMTLPVGPHWEAVTREGSDLVLIADGKGSRTEMHRMRP